MKTYKIKNDTMKESDIQRVYKDPLNPRGSKTYSNKGFVNIDIGLQGVSHWCAFYIKKYKSFYFDTFGGAPDKFILNQLPKPVIYHNYKYQDINSKLCGSYCLYFSI